MRFDLKPPTCKRDGFEFFVVSLRRLTTASTPPLPHNVTDSVDLRRSLCAAHPKAYETSRLPKFDYAICRNSNETTKERLYRPPFSLFSFSVVNRYSSDDYTPVYSRNNLKMRRESLTILRNLISSQNSNDFNSTS